MQEHLDAKDINTLLYTLKVFFFQENVMNILF